MTRKRLVYVAGPISKGCLVSNIMQAHEAGLQLLQSGYSVIVPHGSCFWGNILCPRHCEDSCDVVVPFKPEVLPGETTLEDWYGMDLEIVRRCDAVLRLEGASVGADLEVAEAISHGIPVFSAIDELHNHFMDTSCEIP